MVQLNMSWSARAVIDVQKVEEMQKLAIGGMVR